MTDVLFIVMTAFAMFGFYCFAETVSEIIAVRNFPKSVTIFKNQDDYKTYRKIKYVEQNVPNNSIIFYPEKNLNDNEKLEFEETLKCILEIADNVNNR